MRKFLSFLIPMGFTAAAFANVAPEQTSFNLPSQDYQRLSLQSKTLTETLLEAGKRPIATRAEEENTIITNPEGTRQNLYVSAAKSFYMIGDYLYDWHFDAMPGHIIYNEDKAYIYNPVTQVETGNYIEAEIDGDVMTITLPQMILQETFEGETYSYYVNKFYLDPDYDGVWYWPSETNEPQTVTFNKVDGNWVMEECEDESWLLGLTDAQGRWSGFGDIELFYEQFNYEPVVVPASAKVENWALIQNGNGRMIDVAIDGENVYIADLAYPNIEKGWIKGTILENGTVEFKSEQYLGEYVEGMAYIFFNGGAIEEVYYPEWDFWGTGTVFKEAVYMNYDPEKKSLTSIEDNLFYICNGNNWESPAYYTYYENFEVTYQPEEISYVPANPTFLAAYPFIPENGYAGSVSILIPCLNEDGYLLNADNMYFNIYVDGDLFEFTTVDYPSLTEDMVDVPWWFFDYGVVAGYGAQFSVYFYITDIESYGVQSFYKDGDKVYASELITYEVPVTGIANIAQNEVKSVVYYDLQGRKVMNPERGGIFLKETVLTDGNRIVTKIVK